MTESNDPMEEVVLDLQQVQTLIPQFSSQKLCEMIVCYRYFGFSQETAVACMEQLAIRRVAGDIFDFEKYIHDSLASLPVFNLVIPDLRAILSSLVKKSK